MNPSEIFSIRTKKDFESKVMEVFYFQAEKNAVYKKYLKQLSVHPKNVKNISQIPFLPIEFFKSHKVIIKFKVKSQKSKVFLSSGTTSENRSKHFVSDIKLYEESFRKCFEFFYGDVKQYRLGRDPSSGGYAILALLPSYYENKNSSLLYMVNDLIKRSKKKESRFYQSPEQEILSVTINKLLLQKKKIILFGVSFALLDFLPQIKGSDNLIVIETGGMKGQRQEITREELHKTLREKFGVKKIHSEYGMTELLSQAYSTGNGIFNCPPWMKVFVRDVNDPFQITNYELGMTNAQQTTSGAINIIDLANINSCSFIATQDAGKIYKDGSFEVLGRMDNSDLRGCNLLAG